jgi:hypothetical protein
MTEERIRQAESFLQEAVYQSRARQAAGVGLGGGRPDGPPGSPDSGCGLGADAAVDLELTERGEELLQELWPRATAPTELAHIQEVMSAWVEAQDALDRKRNHYLRDFRQKHGFDRRSYTKEQASEFEAGLAAVNTEVSTRLTAAARTLLGDI